MCVVVYDRRAYPKLEPLEILGLVASIVNSSECFELIYYIFAADKY